MLAELVHDELRGSQQIEAHVAVVWEVFIVALRAGKGWQEPPVSSCQRHQNIDAQGGSLLHELPVRFLGVDVVKADGVGSKLLDQRQILRELVCHLVGRWVAVVWQGRELRGPGLAVGLVTSKHLPIVAVPWVVGNALCEEALAVGTEEHVSPNSNGARGTAGSQCVVRCRSHTEEQRNQSTPHCDGLHGATVSQCPCNRVDKWLQLRSQETANSRQDLLCHFQEPCLPCSAGVLHVT